MEKREGQPNKVKNNIIKPSKAEMVDGDDKTDKVEYEKSPDKKLPGLKQQE